MEPATDSASSFELEGVERSVTINPDQEIDFLARGAPALHPSPMTLSLEQLQRLMRLQGLDRPVAIAMVLDELAAAIELPEAEADALLDAWEQRAGAQRSELTVAEERYLATLPRKLELFRERAFGSDVELRFLDRKLELDQVTYSLIRVDDHDVALEIYQRLVEGEADFDALAPEFSQGSERETAGRIGPNSLDAAHPEISARLRVSQPGQLWEPFFVVNIWVILRLDHFVSAELSLGMREQLIAEIYHDWLEERVGQLLRGEHLAALPLPRDA